MSQQLNEMDVYMKKHLEQQRKKKIIRWVCLILAVILLWVFRTDLLALILPTDVPPYWSRSTVWAAIQLPVQNEKVDKLRFYTEGKSRKRDGQLLYERRCAARRFLGSV